MTPHPAFTLLRPRLLPTAYCLLLILLAGLLLSAAAVWLNSRQQFTVDTPAERLYLRDGFNAPEQGAVGTFRWTQEYAQVVVPHGGPGPLTARLTLLDADPTPRAVWITLDGQEIYRGLTQPGGAPWVLTVQGTARSETPLLGIAATPWTPPGDRRVLGVGFVGLAVETPEVGARAALQEGALVLAVLLWAGVAAWTMGQAGAALIGGLGVLAFWGTLLAYGDPWLGAVAVPGLLLSLALTAIVITRPARPGRPRRAALWGTVALAALLLLLTLGRFNTGDAEAMYQVTAGLVEDGRPWAHQDHAWVKFGLGQPLLDAPLYALGQAWATATGADLGQLTRFCVALLNQGIVPLTALVLFVGARRRYGSPIALALAGTYLLATPALAYSRLAFAEPVSTLLILSGFLLIMGSAERGMRNAEAGDAAIARWPIVAAGLLLGLAVLVKPANAIFLPLPALYLAWASGGLWTRALATQNPKSKIQKGVLRRAAGAVALLIGGTLPGLALTGAYNLLRYGNLFSFGYEGEGFTTALPVGLYGLTLSPGKGLIWFAPPVLLGVVALARLLLQRDRVLRAEAALLGGQAIIVLGFYALWWSWSGNIAWGPRLILPLVPLLLWPLGTLAANRLARRVWWALGGLGFLVAIPGVLIDQFYYFDVSHITKSGTLTEQLMFFAPEWSQIVAQWHFLLTGTREAVLRPTLAQMGLPAAWDFVVPLVLMSAALLALTAALRELRSTADG